MCHSLFAHWVSQVAEIRKIATSISNTDLTQQCEVTDEVYFRWWLIFPEPSLLIDACRHFTLHRYETRSNKGFIQNCRLVKIRQKRTMGKRSKLIKLLIFTMKNLRFLFYCNRHRWTYVARLLYLIECTNRIWIKNYLICHIKCKLRPFINVFMKTWRMTCEAMDKYISIITIVTIIHIIITTSWDARFLDNITACDQTWTEPDYAYGFSCGYFHWKPLGIIRQRRLPPQLIFFLRLFMIFMTVYEIAAWVIVNTKCISRHVICIASRCLSMFL